VISLFFKFHCIFFNLGAIFKFCRTGVIFVISIIQNMYDKLADHLTQARKKVWRICVFRQLFCSARMDFVAFELPMLQKVE
jgi:hypothetical protein